MSRNVQCILALPPATPGAVGRQIHFEAGAASGFGFGWPMAVSLAATSYVVDLPRNTPAVAILKDFDLAGNCIGQGTISFTPSTAPPPAALSLAAPAFAEISDPQKPAGVAAPLPPQNQQI